MLASRRRAEGDQQLFGLFLQDTVSFNDRWQLQIGARGDRWESSDGLRLETVKATGAVTRAEHPPDRDETEFSPRIAVLWSPRDGVGLQGIGLPGVPRAHHQRALPPVPGAQRHHRGERRPRARDSDAGPSSAPTSAVAARASSSTAFWNEVEDAIANVTVGFGPATVVPCGLVPAGGVCRQRQNLERTEIYGGELEFEVRPAPRWRFLMSYLYSDAEILEAPQQRELEGNRLAQVPESQGSMTLEWSDPRLFTITTMARVVDEQFEDDLNSLELATAIVVDIAIQVPIDDRVERVPRPRERRRRAHRVGKDRRRAGHHRHAVHHPRRLPPASGAPLSRAGA